MFKQWSSSTIGNPVIHSDQKRLTPSWGEGELQKISKSWDKRKPIWYPIEDPKKKNEAQFKGKTKPKS